MLDPFAWKDRAVLIEHVLPVQKISAESYKEQMAVQSKTLTTLGSYWKGRKPLILNKACILGCLLPVTDNLLKDLEIFELLMGMDSESMKKRMKARLPVSRHDSVSEYLQFPFNEQVKTARRPEEMDENLYSHIWDSVNDHLGTSASSFPELVEQMGIARFGHRPRVADVFCGSGQIPFEAARLGCDVYASDLNPIACMLTWGAFNIVGASKEKRKEIMKAQEELVRKVQAEIDELDIESDGNGWKAKAFLYCVEVRCPESGWMVPLIPSLIISNGSRIIAKLIPLKEKKKYDIRIQYIESDEDLGFANIGTIQNGYLVHSPDGVKRYRVSIKAIRGDHTEDGINRNNLRLWEKSDFIPRKDDVFQERLYCIQWMRKNPQTKRMEYEFRSVTKDDLRREHRVIEYVGEHLSEWQEKGYIPDMVIEPGYNTDQPVRERGWTHWHHLFSPRQILMLSKSKRILIKNVNESKYLSIYFAKLLDWSTKLCRYGTGASRESITQTFYNQALNTIYNYGVRPFSFASTYLKESPKSYPISNKHTIKTHPVRDIKSWNDIYITDPPYGDAVKYEEITEFFIAWLRKNPPEEFSNWVWDSRRSLAIKGEDESFRQGMIEAYSKMAENMPDNGIQVLMFTHQSGTIWADMAHIIWASGLQVTAAWYVVTETDSALRQGANVKGTVILVLRKRHRVLESYRDELGWEIQDTVKEQVESLIGLDKQVRGQGSEGLYTDADLQMAGYAAALKVLTSYSRIDGKDMVTEAEAPRVRDEKTFVDELIEFAVQTAVQFLVPSGFDKVDWQKLQPVERFYLKMVDMEYQGYKTLDNYQNFAKAFKVDHFDLLMSEKSRANSARLKLSMEFKGVQMSGKSEFSISPLRSLLYAMYELYRDLDIEEVLLHLMENCPDYLGNKPVLIKISDYLVVRRDVLNSTKNYQPDIEAKNARILAEAMRNQRL